MLLNHQKFDFEDKCLIEKVVIQAPFRFSVNFHDARAKRLERAKGWLPGKRSPA
jgi:hypothetical protein